MPRKDGTGPEGQGAKTGRGLGPCNDDKKTVERPGRGTGRGQGGGGRRKGGGR